MPHTYVPTAVTSNVWIIPSNSQIVVSTMPIICPDKATRTVSLQQLFHILRSFPAYSAISRYFHLPQYYEDHSMVMNASLDTANINAINI